MKVYVAGKMRGCPLSNWPAFDRAAAYYRELGHEVINPADLDRANGISCADDVDDAMLRVVIIRDLVELAKCDAIVMLPGWESSKGANVEYALAVMLGLVVIYHKEPIIN